MAVKEAPKRAGRAPLPIEAYLLSGIGAILVGRAWSGQLSLYVHPRYTPLIVTAAIVLVAIGTAAIWREHEAIPVSGSRIAACGLLLTPLLLAVLIPAKAPGATQIDPRQLNMIGRSYRQVTPIATDRSSDWTLMDWTLARYNLRPDVVDGKPVDVIGFVYHDPEEPVGQFNVTRFTIACCVADRSAVSAAVQWPAAASLTNDQWVRVTGQIKVTRAGSPFDYMIVNAQVAPVAAPDDPYLHP